MLIWDHLPDDIQDNIYAKIIFPQNKNLLYDIQNYIFVMKCLLNSDRFQDWDIVWCLILSFNNNIDNKEKNDKMTLLRNSGKNGKYYVSRIIGKLSINDRNDFLNSMFET
tara:strand:+ start:238 stop:567 length:330 start_codon:yes stop_codon:yes gene_type:complete